jgi:dihydrolipoamide dehydrogenase
VLVKVGDTVAKEDSLITLESDKASMDIPSSDAGVVKEIKIKVGDKVAKGTPILVLEAEAGASAATAKTEAAVIAVKRSVASSKWIDIMWCLPRLKL